MNVRTSNRVAHEAVARRVGELLGSDAVDVLEHPALLAPIARATPASLDALSELLRVAAAEDWRVLPIGTGSKLSWSPPPTRCELALSMRALSGVVAYEPGDGTLTALAGTSMEELEEIVRTGGHRLTPDVARPAFATLGGVIAAAQSGVCRTALGPVRNHVLGTVVAQPDGRVTKSGGRLVKNVTGFDLHRLHTGAHGSLGVIVEASLRLFALPAREVVCSSGEQRLEQALETAERVRATRAAPLAIVIEAGLSDEASRPRVHVVLAGRSEAVERDVELVRAALGSDATTCEDDAAGALRRRLRDLEPESRNTLFLHIACKPSVLDRVIEQLTEWLRAHDFPPTFVCHPALAMLDVHLGAARALDLVTGAALQTNAAALRTTLAPRARVELRGGRWASLEEPAPGPVLALQQRLRAALDPRGNMASDRLR